MMKLIEYFCIIIKNVSWARNITLADPHGVDRGQDGPLLQGGDLPGVQIHVTDPLGSCLNTRDLLISKGTVVDA